jgi:hypothetical protein
MVVEDSHEDENIDEPRENRQLKFQLQRQEISTSGAELEMPTTRKIRFDSNTPKPGWEDDYEDYVPTSHLEEKDSFGLELEEKPGRAPVGVFRCVLWLGEGKRAKASCQCLDLLLLNLHGGRRRRRTHDS